MSRFTLFIAAFLFSAAAQAATVAIENARVATQTDAGTIEAGTVHVTDGVVVWVGNAADAPALDGEVERIEAGGRWVTPGLIESYTQLGVVEIEAEATSSDAAVAEYPMGPGFEVRYALNPSSVLIPVTRAAGITTAVVAPRNGNDPLAGTVIHSIFFIAF